MQKFLFDTSFDTREEPPAPEAPPEPTFTLADLEAAREAARAEGRIAGETEALQSVAAATARALAAADQAIAALRDQIAYVAEQARRDGLALAMAAVRALHPRLAASGGLAEIETVMAQCLELARHEPAIVFRFHPDVLEAASRLVESMAAARAFTGKLVILADPRLAVDGCAVEWADGGAERNSEAVLEQIERLVAQVTGGAADNEAGHPAGAGDQG